jgi:hypothetical protein
MYFRKLKKRKEILKNELGKPELVSLTPSDAVCGFCPIWGKHFTGIPSLPPVAFTHFCLDAERKIKDKVQQNKG